MYNICVLVKANSKEDAIDEADWFIDDLEEYGYIKPTDNVMVDTTISPVVGCEAPNEFVDRLMAEHDRRNDVLQATITRFHTRMQQIGRTDLNDLIPADRGDDTTIRTLEVIGDELIEIGTIVATYWHPACTLFNREMRHAGIRPQELATVCANPRHWALVWIQVH